MCTELGRQVNDLGQGEHLCLFYESAAEQRAALLSFLRDGLARGERCLWIAEHPSDPELSRALAAGGIDVPRECGRGALLLQTSRETYLREGKFDPRQMIALLHQAVEEALAAGFAGLRATGDMTWALGLEGGTDSLIEYEALLNDFFPRQPALGLCQYDRRRFAPAVLPTILRTHPVAVLGDQVCRNLYYEPPEQVLASEPTARQVDWMLHQIRQGHVVEQTLQESNRQLDTANHHKDQFLATLAHELRNPLAPLRNALHVIRVAGDKRPAVTQACRIAERQVLQLTRLVDDLLDLSRIARGKLELRKEPVELGAVVAGAVEATRPLLKSRRHDLALSLPTKAVRLEADPARLEQILVNLLSNAAKYTDPGGRIGLTAECQESEVVLRVRDNGVGIAPDLLARVFEPFVQAEQAPDRSQGGLGIGLALVRTLIEMHGGTIVAASPGRGRGSEFTLRLPIVPEAPAQAIGTLFKADNPGRGQTGRILVVDDNVDAAQSLAVVLNLWGHEVCLAHDGAAALEAAQVYQPDVVLLDIGLPGMDGYEVARRLRARPVLNPPLLVALTGYGQDEDRRRSQEAGFDRHLVKPVDLETLELLLAQSQWLDRSAPANSVDAAA